MSDNLKELEYKEAINAFRYQLEYRMKIFNFSLAFNGVLLPIVFQYISSVPAKIAGCVFGVIATIIFWLSEKRAVFVATQYSDYAIKLEKELGLSLLTDVLGKLRSSTGRFRYYFASLYILVLCLWFFQLFYILFYL